MPVLKQETKRIYLSRFSNDENGKELPKEEQGWIDVLKKPTLGIMREVLLKGESINQNQTAIGVEMLPRMIADWNLTDANGRKLEVSVENIDILSMEDMKELMESVDFASLGVKKKK